MDIDSSPTIIREKRLDDLLAKAKSLLLKKGVRATSQRGFTYSLNKILLIWEEPVKSTEKARYSFRTKKEDLWYQKIFVEKTKSNLPGGIAKRGDIVFPYKYAERSRYYDAGWGYGLSTVMGLKEIGVNLNTAIKNEKNFEEFISLMGEYQHAQTVLAVLAWWGKPGINFWYKNLEKLKMIAQNSRVDMLDRITREVAKAPETRRAIMPSFMYTTDYLLDPMMGVPPYQNFQLLPGQKSDKLSSLHWHRSLDASGGAQLDFNHDFSWLAYACKKTKRKMGSISVMTGNLHLYMPEETNNVSDWLLRVTDGYKAGQGDPAKLLERDAYSQNLRKVYHLLK